MIKIGIECESIEGKNPMFGVGRVIVKLLEEVSSQPELAKNYKFILYFKDSIPDFSFLNAPIFEKKITPVPFIKNRLFPIYYFALLPMRLWFEKLDWMFWPNYMLPIIATGKSIVMLTEDVYYETYAKKLPFRYRLAYFIFGWWTAKFATKIMAISETSKKNVAKLYKINPNKIFTAHLGVGSASAEATARLQHKEGDYLLYVGQMFPRRHARETILAFKKFITEHSHILENVRMSDLKLVMVGHDKYNPPVIKELVQKTNQELGSERIVHHDYLEKRENLEKLYSGAKALIYVSDGGAFGLPPLEGVAFGVSPVIMDNELGHELFEDYAFYSKSGDADEITEAVRQALTQLDKIQKIKNSGPEFVKKYNWKSFAEIFFENVKS